MRLVPLSPYDIPKLDDKYVGYESGLLKCPDRRLRVSERCRWQWRMAMVAVKGGQAKRPAERQQEKGKRGFEKRQSATT